MTKAQFTARIHLKGWRVKDVLARWGRSQKWWNDNAGKGDAHARARLNDMIAGLETKSL